MNTRECLTLLNLDSSSTGENLKLAYRKAVKQWHPDRHQQASEASRTTAEQQMQALNKAYTTLSKYYDKHGHMPGYIAPDFESSFTTDVPPTQTPQPESSHHSETTQRHSAWSEPARAAASSEKMKKGSLWLVGLVVIGVMLYLYSVLNNEPTEPVLASAQQESHQAPRINSESGPGTEKTPSEEVEPEEVKSPFAIKERKSAFEPSSSLGIYEESADEKYFTYGDTAGRVFELQGVPTKTVGDIWYYGKSEVHFHEGKVEHWFVAEGSMLKAKEKRHGQ